MAQITPKIWNRILIRKMQSQIIIRIRKYHFIQELYK